MHLNEMNVYVQACVLSLPLGLQVHLQPPSLSLLGCLVPSEQRERSAVRESGQFKGTIRSLNNNNSLHLGMNKKKKRPTMSETILN